MSNLPKLIRMLASDNPNEVFAAAQAMQRALKAEGRDLNDFADALEGTRQEPIEAKNEMTDVGTIDPASIEILEALVKDSSGLRPKEHEFVASLYTRYKRFGKSTFLSEKQETWLRDIGRRYKPWSP